MRATQLLFLLLVAAAAPSTALALPPPNDNYLDSTPLHDEQRKLPRTTLKDQIETAEATTQDDLFAPRDTGGGPEDLDCGTTRFGKTVWYDIHADTWGVAEFQASGFPTVVAAYEYDPITADIIRTLGCAGEAGTTTDAVFPVERGHWYTVQIGGVDVGAGAAGGLLQLTFDFFPDRDRDTVFDALDACDDQRGVKRFGGCLPELKSSHEYRYTTVGGGVRLTSLVLTRVARGTRVDARCVRGCSVRQTATANGSRRMRLTRFFDAVLPDGARVEIRRTHPRTKRGIFKYGAIGSFVRLDVRDGRIVRTIRCLKPNAKRPRRDCVERSQRSTTGRPGVRDMWRAR